MTTGVYKYQNKDRSVYFRGYVKKYAGRKLLVKSCVVVRKTKAEALLDARKLLSKL
mgnify:CR=1 FL=1